MSTYVLLGFYLFNLRRNLKQNVQNHYPQLIYVYLKMFFEDGTKVKIPSQIKYTFIYCNGHFDISLKFSGETYETILVTSDGKLVANFDRKYAAKAHSLQIGLIWIYGMNYAGKPKNEKDKKIKNFFEFCLYYLWDLQPKIGSKKKRACQKVQIFMDLIEKYRNRNRA